MGGYSLYQGPDGLPRDRGYAVSFDRPYDQNGAGRFLFFDQSAIALAEKTGIPLAYETDVDLDLHPGIWPAPAPSSASATTSTIRGRCATR